MSSSSSLRRALLLSSVLCLALAACSGPNPNRLTKDRIEPSEDAQKLLEELAGPNVGSMDDTLRNAAAQSMATQNYGDAAQYYAQLVQKNPDELSYKLAYADALRKGGKYDDAILAYEKLLEEEEGNIDALEGLGLSYMEDGEFDLAGDVLAEVMEKDGKRWRTNNAIGILFTTKQMYPEARQYFEEGMLLERDTIAVRNNLALMEALDQNYDESVRLLQEAVQIGGKRGDSRKQLELNLALVYAIKGDLDMAETTIIPHLTEAERLNNMGFYARLQGDDPLAKSYLSMALTKSEKYYDKAWKNLETLNKLRSNAPSS